MSKMVDISKRHGLLFLTMLGWVVGTSCQLLEVKLHSVSFYVTVATVNLVFIVFIALSIAKKRGSTFKRDYRFLVFIAIPVLVGSLAYGLTGLRAAEYSKSAFPSFYEGRDIEVVGVVSNLPSTNDIGTRFQLDVESAVILANSKGDQKNIRDLPLKLSLSWYGGVFGVEQRLNLQDVNISTKFLNIDNAREELDQLTISLQRKPMQVLPGERWKMTVRLKAPHGNSNPDGFDYELWLWEQGVQATGYVRTSDKDAAPTRMSQTWQYPVDQLRFKVRDAIFNRMSIADTTSNSLAHHREAGVVAALVTGDQQSIEKSDWDVFRNTGVAHLMSISGLHITMFAWGAVIVVGWLYRRSSRLCLMYPSPQAALVGGLLLATLYAVFSGWGVPSQRTIWMLTTVTLLRLLGKQWPWQSVWMLACAVVVLIDPWALMQAGFWLSFIAVGVLFASDTNPYLMKDQNGKKNSVTDIHSDSAIFQSSTRQRIDAIKRTLWLSSREQIIITLALTPLTLLLFGQISVVGLLANALAIPWVTLVVTPLAMLGNIFAPFWDLAGLATHALSLYLGVLDALPLSTYSMATPPVLLSIIGVLGGVLIVMPWPWQIRSLGLPLLLTVILWQAPRPEAGQFELIAADIGQGNGLIVRTAKHTLVYDAGPRFSIDSDAGNRVLVPLLRRTNEEVNTVVLSHRDIDHSGGIKSLLSMHPKAKFISSVENSHDLQAFRPVKRCIAGQSWQWDGIDFDVLHPSAEDYELPNKSNAMSCVLRVSNKEHSVLMVGDIEKAQELRLVNERVTEQQNNEIRTSLSALKSTVLLVPHHGSKTSSSEAFLDAVQPQMAIVQAGYRNRFGHPASAVMDRYQERSIKVIDTPHCGAMIWSSAKPYDTLCQREVAKRYWHHQVP